MNAAQREIIEGVFCHVGLLGGLL